jgi:hypothetical protein
MKQFEYLLTTENAWCTLLYFGYLLACSTAFYLKLKKGK